MASGNRAIPHPVDLHVGRQVRTRRLQLGYSQSDLAQALGVTFQQIQRYESGANRISASMLWRIARFLRADAADFFEGLDQPDRTDASCTEPDDSNQYTTPRARTISRMAARLPARRQMLAAGLIREMSRRRPPRPH